MIRNSEGFADMEYCLQHYFDGNIRPLMQAVRKELTERQAKELKEHEGSARGILSQIAKSMSADTFYNPKDSLAAVAKWNSKTAEEYVDMCRERIAGNSSIGSDMVLFADEWRKVVTEEIGSERYASLSAKIGCDLALAYTNYRFEQMMVDYMVKQEMPKSSFEYIMRKGADNSLIGLGSTMNRSPLQQEIDRRGEAMYNPTGLERGAGHAVAIGADIAVTGGTSTWSSIAKMAGVDVVFSGIDSILERRASAAKCLTVEECISQGVFGSGTNVFDGLRERSRKIAACDNRHVQEFNDTLSNKMVIPKEMLKMTDWREHGISFPKFGGLAMAGATATAAAAGRDDVPLVVPDDKVEEYREMVRNQKNAAQAAEASPVTEDDGLETGEEVTQQPDVTEDEQQPTNESGWSTLLSTLGLEGIGDIGANLGYVIATLPDMISGLFTGRTQSVNMKNGMLPLASILMGMFVKNPLLRMMLIGLGGANLMNKAGHEALERQEPARQFRRYDDEPLDSRVCNPVIRGDCLVATIDRVPCSVTLPQTAVDAYRCGALPLNTLVNAVLERSDSMKRAALSNCREMELMQGNERQLTMK
jgi:hypothetical protein